MNQSASLNAAILRTPAERKRQDVRAGQRGEMHEERERERKADGRITKLEEEEEADEKTGEEGRGAHCEWMGQWIEKDCG